MVKKVISMVLVLMMLAAFVVGCGQAKTEAAAPSGSTTQVKQDTASNVAPATDNAAKPADNKKLTFGMIIPILSHGWQVLNKEYAEEACKELGVDLITFDGQGNDEKQITDLQALIERKVDGLLLDPNVAATGVKMVEMANKAGIPAIFFDREPETKTGGQYLSFVGPDSREGGYRIAKYLFDNGVKKLIEIDGLPGSAPAAERAEGLAKAAKEYPDVKILAAQPGNWDMDKGMNVTQDLLTAHPDADGIWAANDMMGMGALAAVDKKGNKNIKIASIDVDPDAVKLIKEGRQLQYTCGAHYICGAISAILMYDHIKGVQIPNRVEFKMLSVDKNNADKFLKVNDARALLKGKIQSLSKAYTPNAPDDRFDKVLDLNSIKVD